MKMRQKNRPIRSYVLRQGRSSPAQKAALNNYWPQYGLRCEDGLLESSQAFGRCANIILEIGFGNGDSLIEQAKQQPENNFIGIEVHSPGVGSLLQKIVKESIDNIRIYQEDALSVLTQCIADNSLSSIQIFFPDPWHKKRHHKRRLINASFRDLVAQKLQHHGIVHLATDWQDYAQQMMAVFSETDLFENCPILENHPAAKRIITKFEQRGIERGHDIWDMMFTKTKLLNKI